MESFLSKSPSPCYKSKGKFVIDMKRNFFAAASIAALLAITAPFQRASGQTKQGTDPEPVKTEEVAANTYASNDKKPSAIFTSNKNSIGKNVAGTTPPLSVEQQAREYSQSGQGLGFVIYKGKLDKNTPDSTLINTYEKFFEKKKINAKVFIEEKPEFSGSLYKAYIKGTNFYGIMAAPDLKKNMPDIIKSQQAYESRLAANNVSPVGME